MRSSYYCCSIPYSRYWEFHERSSESPRLCSRPQQRSQVEGIQKGRLSLFYAYERSLFSCFSTQSERRSLLELRRHSWISSRRPNSSSMLLCRGNSLEDHPPYRYVHRSLMSCPCACWRILEGTTEVFMLFGCTATLVMEGGATAAVAVPFLVATVAVCDAFGAAHSVKVQRTQMQVVRVRLKAHIRRLCTCSVSVSFCLLRINRAPMMVLCTGSG